MINSVAELIDFIILGIVNGSIYALAGVGLALLFGVLRVLNVAHGYLFALGGYFSILVITKVGVNPIIALFLTISFFFLIGMILHKTLFAPLRFRREKEFRGETYLVLTLGLSIFIENTLLVVAGPNAYALPSFIDITFYTSGISISGQRLFVLVLSMILLVSLFIFLKRTKLGLAIRATSEDLDTARAMGISVDRIFMITVGISTALAAASGSIVTPILWVFPTIGWLLTMKIFAIIIFGGLGSMPGSLIGGFALGITESLSVAILTSEVKDAVALLMMISVLILRPSGLFGKRLRP